jgi:hypothetical protein
MKRGGFWVYALYGHDHDMHTTLPNCAYITEGEAQRAADSDDCEWLIKPIWVPMEGDRL